MRPAISVDQPDVSTDPDSLPGSDESTPLTERDRSLLQGQVKLGLLRVMLGLGAGGFSLIDFPPARFSFFLLFFLC